MFLPDVFNLGKAYQQYFEIVPAYSDELRDEVYRIRHQVYCEELKYEPSRADQRERDDYDAQSIHLLIRSLHTKTFIGCTRLVRARLDDPFLPLPFEKTCGASLDRSVVDPSQMSRTAIAEVSRLAVVAQFRNRKGDVKKAVIPVSDSDFGSVSQPRFPYIPIGLYLGTVELARLNDIDNLFVLTEQRLASHFRKLGVDIKTIGAPVEHRGQRIPSMLNTRSIIDNMRMMVRPLYRVIAAEVAGAPKLQ